MHFKNLKIATQLRLTLGALVLLFAVLCLLSWRQSNTLWRQTAAIYQHPLAVQMAVAEIKTAVLGSQGSLRDLALSGDAPPLIHDIETSADHVGQQLDIISGRYLGPSTDIDLARQAFRQWRDAQSAAVRAMAVTPQTNRAAHAGQEFLARIESISAFASSKAKQLYTEAEADQHAMLPRLFAFLALLMLVSGGIMFHLLGSLRTPLRELTHTAERFRRGDYSQRVAIESRNEFGVLGAAFNSLAETVDTELTLKEDLVQLAEVMLRKGDLRAFCRHVLAALLHHTEAHSGAVYLLDEDSQEFRYYDSIGLSVKQNAFSAANLEGEFGPVIASGQIRRIADIPQDTRFALSTVSGSFVPREIVTIPVQSGQNVVAIVSLASLVPYSAQSLRLLEEIRNVLSARLNALILNRTLRDFTAQLEQQNVELEIQKKELAAQAAQLQEQNTELEVQKQRMDEANRLKSAFLSNMSHELRTPLNSVIALSEVLNRRLRPTIPAEERNYLEMIERNGRQLLELINSILDLSRIEAGREDVRIEPFQIRDLTRAVVETLAPQAQGKGIELRHRIPEDLPLVRSDFVKCRHILQNLVANAVKFTDTGYVDVTAAQTGGAMLITVRDTGIGIQESQIPYIFDEFRQGDESTTRTHGGTGLGLAIAHKYAVMLHGDIDVRSAPGEGSSFTLRLPLDRSTDVSPAPPRPAPHAASRSGEDKRLLLVEDSEPAVIQLRDILTTQGYRVDSARNGREALEHIAHDAPDAMILDLMMPEVDGFEVLRQVRAMTATTRLPVLILTAKHITREELSFLEGNHIHQLVQKGDINKADLLATIAAMVFPPPDPKPAARPAKPLPSKSVPTEAVPARPAGRTGTRGHRPVILVVEDNPDNMTTMRALLQDKATLVEADNGQTGVLAAKAHRPDLILMDISLPFMDGFAALDALRADPDLHAIPVIAVTASAMVGDRETILNHGFDAYLSKPIDGTALEQTIETVLEGGKSVTDAPIHRGHDDENSGH